MRISINIDKINNRKLADRLKLLMSSKKKSGDDGLVSDMTEIFSPYLENVLNAIPLEEVLPKILECDSVIKIIKGEASKFGVSVSSVKGEK